MRARLPGAATVEWLTAAWTDTGRATAAAAELAAIAAVTLLLAYAGTIIALTSAGGAAALAVRAAGLAWRTRQQLGQPENGTSRSFPDHRGNDAQSRRREEGPPEPASNRS